MSVVLYRVKSLNDTSADYDKQTLMFFDLDNTLINENDELLETPTILKKVHCVTMGFTARASSRKYKTLRVLNKLGISFSSILPYQKYSYKEKMPSLYNSILFSDDLPKGDVCTLFLDSLYTLPATIVLIDDLLENLKSVGEAITKYNRMHDLNITYHAYHIVR